MTPMPGEPAAQSSGEWTFIISPNARRFDLQLRELWRSRDLIALFVWRDFVSVYKQTVLGPLWYVIQPILTTLMFTLVFGRIANLSSDGVPHFVFYLAGTVMWTYFATCLTKTSNTFVQNAGLFGKVYFPRTAVPASVVISGLATFGVQMVLLVAVIAVMKWQTGSAIRPNFWALLMPLLVIITAAFGAGLGLIVSAATTRYRDLQQLIGFGVGLLMYATPVIYPLSIAGPRYRWLLQANPLTSVIETFRYAFLGSGTVSGMGLAYSGTVAVLILLAGVSVFNRVERTFMDSV